MATETGEPVVLGDGATEITAQADRHFPEALGILDWAHARRTLHKARRTACSVMRASSW